MKNIQLIDQEIAKLTQDLEADTDFDITIRESAHEVASKLLLFKRYETLINGKYYTLSYIRLGAHLKIILIDHIRLKIARHQYKPAIFESELNEELTEIENLQKLVETIYYYKYDQIRTEDIIDEEDSLWEVEKQNK